MQSEKARRRTVVLDAASVLDGDDARACERRELLTRKGFALTPEEELLAEAIRSGPDLAHADLDPYDPHAWQPPMAARASLSGAGVSEQASGPSQCGNSLADIDARLMDLALDHEWTDARSLARRGSAPASSTQQFHVAGSAISVAG